MEIATATRGSNRRFVIRFLAVTTFVVVALAIAPAALAVPPLELPFARGAIWWANGPHSSDGKDGARNSVDLGPGGPAGAAALAAGAGVARVGTCPGGYYVRVEHGGGWTTQYWHLASVPAGLDGKSVQTGDLVGTTGIVCGNPTNFSHIHFSLFLNGAPYALDGVSIGGYTIREGTGQYNGSWVRNSDGVVVRTTTNEVANCCLPNDQPSAQPGRIGFLSTDRRFFAKEGAINAPWVLQTDGAKAIAAADSRLGFLRTDGVVFAKEGAINAPWIEQTNGAQAIAMAGDRIGFLRTDGYFFAKEGAINAPWVSQTDGGLAICLPGSCGSPPIDSLPPETFIGDGPPDETQDVQATFNLSSYETPVVFECSLDGASWSLCTSPAVYSGLTVGAHTFAARSKDVAGNVDPTPATWSWRVVAPPPTAPTPPPPGGGAGSGGGSGGGGGGGSPDLELTGGASTPTARAGDTILYVLNTRIKNHTQTWGGSNLTLTIQLPAGVELLSARTNRGAGCSGTSAVVCQLDFLNSTIVATAELAIRVMQEGELVLSASVRANETDLDQTNNAVSIRVATPAPSSATPPTDDVQNTTKINVVRGTSSNNVISGTAASDRLFGLGGNDTLFGRGGIDLLLGGSGNDRLVGGPGRDDLRGGAGNDTIESRDESRDTVDCGSGRDTVIADKLDSITRTCEIVRRR